MVLPALPPPPAGLWRGVHGRGCAMAWQCSRSMRCAWLCACVARYLCKLVHRFVIDQRVSKKKLAGARSLFCISDMRAVRADELAVLSLLHVIDTTGTGFLGFMRVSRLNKPCMAAAHRAISSPIQPPVNRALTCSGFLFSFSCARYSFDLSEIKYR